jgi:hypothetical protein
MIFAGETAQRDETEEADRVIPVAEILDEEWHEVPTPGVDGVSRREDPHARIAMAKIAKRVAARRLKRRAAPETQSQTRDENERVAPASDFADAWLRVLRSNRIS